MDLKLIKTRYAGQCKKCNREIKEGWEVYFDAETKSVYCKPCGKELLNVTDTSTEKPILNNELQKEMDSLSPQMREYLEKMGLIKPPSLEDKIDLLLGSTSAIIDLVGSLGVNLSELYDMVASLTKEKPAKPKD